MIERRLTERVAFSEDDMPSEPLVSVSPRRVEELQAEARYHRERYDLYKARTYGPRLTSDTRLRELERRHHGAESRLRSAQQQNELVADGSRKPDAG
jgi:hypothetical protein